MLKQNPKSLILFYFCNSIISQSQFRFDNFKWNEEIIM